MFTRNLSENLQSALSDSPVVLLIGARQVGKSTLVQSIKSENYQPNYITFDDPTVLAAAGSSPTAFLDGLKLPIIFDEIQRAPELFLPIKAAVDRNRQSGAFLLTGSANVLTLPKVADSLAGRMELLTLRPLSQGEIEGRKENFIDRVFDDDFKLPNLKISESREELFGRMLAGGFPEAVNRKTEARRQAWFKSYIATLLQRDVRDLANIEGLRDLPRLLSILAARAGGLLNYAEISRSAGFPQTTLKRYTVLLEAVFLIEPLAAWSGSLTKRLMKTPKLFFTDTGLLASLLGLTWSRFRLEPTLAGMIVENFVVGELQKQTGWSKTDVNLFHFRTQTDTEVDVVMETNGGETVGIEIKSSGSVGADAFKGLRVLEEDLGKKFKRGIVLYAGEKSVAFGEKMCALPIQSLWLL
jgi:predicted AAA+ superfamily ATPase